jgi:pyruvate dehydrogenase E2 component (dihydrolipoamide acetyltransferase)
MADFLMPQLGADMTAATLTEWLKKPGDKVTHGDIVAVVETDKGAIEIEVFEDGVIERQLVEPGAKVPVGTVMATIAGKRAEPSAAPARPAEIAPLPSSALATAPVKSPDLPRILGERTKISPAAARLAADLGVDIRTLSGSGPGGAIRIADVEMAKQTLEPGTIPDKAEPTQDVSETQAAAMRRAIAASMGRSKREIPHYYLSTSIDMGRALDWLSNENENRPVTERLIYSVLLIKAVARALESFPELNGFWRNDRFQAADEIHIGWAVSLRGGGLVAPAIHNAGQNAVDQLMATLRDLVKRARAFHLRGSELSDPTITVTSLGEQGVDSVFGVIYPPQVALVGFGRITERPWVFNEAVHPRPIIQASLAADHRTSDGHRGGLFLSTIDRLLQEPATL